jgi:hypothetical protein
MNPSSAMGASDELGGVSGLILAGGRSSRMGRDKAFLPFPAPDGPPLIARQAALLRSLGIDDLLISGRAGVEYTTTVPAATTSNADCTVADSHRTIATPGSAMARIFPMKLHPPGTSAHPLARSKGPVLHGARNGLNRNTPYPRTIDASVERIGVPATIVPDAPSGIAIGPISSV